MKTALEIDEQQTFIQYLKINKIRYAAIPNGTYIKSIAGRAKAKKEGLQKGFPDLIIFMSDHILFVEMKRTKGGTVSPEQKEWNGHINGYSYARAIIAHGAREAINYIEQNK